MATGLTFSVFGRDVSATKTLKSVEQSAGKSAKTIGSHFRKMGSVIAAGFAGAGVVSFLKGSFDEATEAQKVGAQTAAVLKSTGGAARVTAGHIGELATALSNKVGIDDEVIQSGQNLLLTFTGVRNEVGKGNDIFDQSTKIMTDMSVALGQDMKSSALQLGKALNNPIKGVTALQRVGVSFADAQKKQIKTLVDSGRTMDAQKLILRELNREFGGAAAAQVTPAEKAKVAWGNLQELIGTKLLPIVTVLANFVVQKVVPAIESVVHWVEDHRKGFEKLGQVVKNVAVGVYQHLVKPALDALIPIIRAIVGWVKEHHKGLEQLARFLAGVFVTSFKIAIGVFRVAIDIIKAVIRVVQVVIDVFRGIFNGLKWAWDHIGRPIFNGIKSGIAGVQKVIEPIVNGISNAFQGMGDGLSWVWNNVIRPTFNAIKSGVQSVLNALDSINPFSGGIKIDANYLREHGITPRANAQGTGYWRGGVTRYNEQGPEAFVPAGMSIRTATATASAMRMGGGAQTINLTVKVEGGLATNREVQQAVGTALEYYVGRGNRIPGVTN